MTSIRIAVASVLAAGALLAGGTVAVHYAESASAHPAVVASPIKCCDAVKAVTG